MTTRILTTLLLLTFGLNKAQNLSTVFIDTIDIMVNNKKIYTAATTTLKFIPNTKDIKLTFYDDGIHKLIVSFALSTTNGPNSLVLSSPHFYINDTSYALSQIDESDYEQCLETLIGNSLLQNWGYNMPEPLMKTQIKLYYRLMNFAPLDTTNYKYNYKEGIWIGAHKDAKKVTVSFQNDKRNGLAKALYSDGASYNVNFKDNVADNYGQGYWENYGERNKLKFSYTIPSILGACYSANSNSYSSFDFCRGSKTKEVLGYHDLSVHYDKNGIKNDSVKFHVRGDFISITNDSIIIQSEDFDVHDFYKKNTDSLHYFSKVATSGFVKVPMKDISKIYYERSEWKTFTLRTTLLSLASALIVSPLISIQKSDFNYERFSKVTTASLGVAVLSISFGIAFSQKEFLIKPTRKSNKTWKIKPTDY
jgi:hypothetical protein